MDDYLGPMNIDDLGRMLLALLSEHWILRDRFAVLEALMVERGALSPNELDDYVVPAELAARIETLRERTVGAVIGAPLAATARGVPDILARAGMKIPSGV